MRFLLVNKSETPIQGNRSQNFHESSQLVGFFLSTFKSINFGDEFFYPCVTVVGCNQEDVDNRTLLRMLRSAVKICVFQIRSHKKEFETPTQTLFPYTWQGKAMAKP